MSDLEKFVDRLCREQPPLKAPAALSARVLAEIERRAAQPWWHRAFNHWPVPVRAAFVGACALIALTSLSAPIARALASMTGPLAWVYRTGSAVGAINGVFSHVGGDIVRSASPLWLYGTSITLVGLYVVFAGLCAMTYRTLYMTVERTAGTGL